MYEECQEQNVLLQSELQCLKEEISQKQNKIPESCSESAFTREPNDQTLGLQESIRELKKQLAIQLSVVSQLQQQTELLESKVVEQHKTIEQLKNYGKNLEQQAQDAKAQTQKQSEFFQHYQEQKSSIHTELKKQLESGQLELLTVKKQLEKTTQKKELEDQRERFIQELQKGQQNIQNQFYSQIEKTQELQRQLNLISQSKQQIYQYYVQQFNSSLIQIFQEYNVVSLKDEVFLCFTKDGVAKAQKIVFSRFADIYQLLHTQAEKGATLPLRPQQFTNVSQITNSLQSAKYSRNFPAVSDFQKDEPFFISELTQLKGRSDSEQTGLFYDREERKHSQTIQKQKSQKSNEIMFVYPNCEAENRPQEKNNENRAFEIKTCEAKPTQQTFSMKKVQLSEFASPNNLLNAKIINDGQKHRKVNSASIDKSCLDFKGKHYFNQNQTSVSINTFNPEYRKGMSNMSCLENQLTQVVNTPQKYSVNKFQQYKDLVKSDNNEQKLNQKNYQQSLLKEDEPLKVQSMLNNIQLNQSSFQNSKASLIKKTIAQQQIIPNAPPLPLSHNKNQVPVKKGSISFMKQRVQQNSGIKTVKQGNQRVLSQECDGHQTSCFMKF